MKATIGCYSVMMALLLGCQPKEAADTATSSSPPVNLQSALAQAEKENKLVLLDFTGSDWCPPCKKLNKEVFSTAPFQGYAKSNLVFVEVDFPANKKQSDEEKKANAELASRFNVEGYPTLVLLDSKGTTLWRQTGFGGGSPDEFIQQLQSAKPK